MDIIIEPEAEKDLKEVKKQNHRRFIRSKLQELGINPTNHENTKLIRIKNRHLYRFKMKEGNRGGRDYRAIYDIIEGEIRIISIFHRDQGYDKESISDRV